MSLRYCSRVQESEYPSVRQKTISFTLLPVVLALLAITLVRPLDASAATVNGAQPLLRPHHGVGNNVQPLVTNLVYHSPGPVMRGTSQAYAIFWEPSGSFVSSTYNSLISRYFGDVGGSGLYANNTQYKDSTGVAPSGSTFGGSWVDTSSYPSGSLTDAQVQAEVSKALSTKGWTASLTHIFFVFTAKGENICYDSSDCSFTTFCAYHGFFGSNTMYGAMPYTGTNLSACGTPSSPNGDFDADSTINVTSHEQMEAATDPHLNAWYDSSGEEIGDKCAWNFGTIGSDGGNITLNGHRYILQKEWDNKARGCVLSGP